MERKPIVNNCSVWVGGDSFVQVIDAKVKGLVNDLNLEIKIVNNHSLTLKRIDYKAVFFTSGNQQINTEPFYVEGQEVNIKPSQIGIGSIVDLSKSFSNASYAEIRLISAHFEGDNVLDLVYEKMEKMPLESLSDLEIELLREVAGNDAINLPIQGMSNWRCVCGYFNGELERCSNCGREKKAVLEEYESIDKIKETIEKKMAIELEKATINEKPIEELEEEKEEQVSKIIDESENEDLDIKEYFNSFPKSQMIMIMASGVMVMSSVIMWVIKI